jgi:CspA family cold shock protein
MGGTFVQKAAVMAEGTVKSFDDAIGKGMIAREGSKDVFVNRAAIKHEGPRTLAAGDRVRFQLVEGLNGPCAAGVHRL